MVEWDFMGFTRPGERLQFANWKDPPFCSWENQLFLWLFSIAMLVKGKSTISMAIFNCYASSDTIKIVPSGEHTKSY